MLIRKRASLPTGYNLIFQQGFQQGPKMDTIKNVPRRFEWCSGNFSKAPIDLGGHTMSEVSTMFLQCEPNGFPSNNEKNLTQSALQKIAPGECDQLCEQQGWQCWLCQWTPHHTSEKLRLVNIKRQTFDEYFTFAICVLFYDEHLTFAIDVFIFSLSVPSNPSLWGSWW